MPDARASFIDALDEAMPMRIIVENDFTNDFLSFLDEILRKKFSVNFSCGVKTGIFIK